MILKYIYCFLAIFMFSCASIEINEYKFAKDIAVDIIENPYKVLDIPKYYHKYYDSLFMINNLRNANDQIKMYKALKIFCESKEKFEIEHYPTGIIKLTKLDGYAMRRLPKALRDTNAYIFNIALRKPKADLLFVFTMIYINKKYFIYEWGICNLEDGTPFEP